MKNPFYHGIFPIAKTNEIGHGANSKGMVIGKEICLCADKNGSLYFPEREGYNESMHVSGILK